MADEKQVVLDGTRYVVRFDMFGPYMAYRRHLYAAGKPYAAWHNVSIWCRSSSPRPKRGKVARVLEAAEA